MHTHPHPCPSGNVQVLTPLRWRVFCPGDRGRGGGGVLSTIVHEHWPVRPRAGIARLNHLSCYQNTPGLMQAALQVEISGPSPGRLATTLPAYSTPTPFASPRRLRETSTTYGPLRPPLCNCPSSFLFTSINPKPFCPCYSGFHHRSTSLIYPSSCTASSVLCFSRNLSNRQHRQSLLSERG